MRGLRRAGYDVQELADAGYSVLEMRAAGFTAEDVEPFRPPRVELVFDD